MDKQSGMDHFEVLEIRHDQELGVVSDGVWDKLMGKDKFSPEWKTAEIPYLLEDQDLLSIIRVKAIDKAGNERFVEYISKEASLVKDQNESGLSWPIILGLILLLIVSGLIVVLIKKIIINKKYDKE